jgi:hypothetical protein
VAVAVVDWRVVRVVATAEVEVWNWVGGGRKESGGCADPPACPRQRGFGLEEAASS